MVASIYLGWKFDSINYGIVIGSIRLDSRLESRSHHSDAYEKALNCSNTTWGKIYALRLATLAMPTDIF